MGPQITPNAQAANGNETNNAPALAATNTPAITTPHAQAADGNSEETEVLSLEAARKLRSEAASLRQRERAALERLAVLEAAEAKRQEADMTAQQRAEKALADAQSTHTTKIAAMQARILAAQIESQAAKLGIIDPEAAMKLLDRDGLELDSDGLPTNLEKALAALIKAKPYLVGKTPPTNAGGVTNPARSASAGGAGWDLARYQQLVSTPGAYQRLSPTEQQELSTWLSQRR